MIATIMLVLLTLLLGIITLLIIQRRQGKPIPLAVIFVLAIMASMLAATLSFVHKGEDYQAYQTLKWHPLAPEKIAPLVAQGYTVFIDITSDWCTTCQTNKAEVTHRETVVNALKANHIVLMQGNWSQEDSIIETYMRGEGVPGTPYNKIYGPAAPNGIVLPTQLSIDAVFKGLASAKTR